MRNINRFGKKSLLLAAAIACIVTAATLKKPIETKADVLPTCYQQGDARWAYEQFGTANIGASGCGLLSTVNAVNYQTGNFINPVELARWGYENNYYNGTMGQGTVRWQFYPALNDAFGNKYGFKISGCAGGNITSDALINHLKSGGSAIVHVYNHFMALNGYNSETGRYLVYDSAAAPKRNTSVSGSWLTAQELNSNSLTIVDWYCLVTKTGSSTPTPAPVTAYALKAESSGNGKVHFGDNLTSATVQAGTVVNYQTTPDSGYKVSEILINGVPQTIKNDGGDAVYQFTMPEKGTTVTAVFEKIATPVYLLNATVLSGDGKVHFGNGLVEATVAENTLIYFEINPSKGFIATEILINDVPQTIENGGRDYVYSFNMPAKNTIVSVKFEQARYTAATTVSAGNGTVHFGNGITEATFTAGTTVNYQTTPASGFKVSEILINGVPQTIKNDGIDAVYQFNMPDENVTLSVKFEQEEVILSLNASVLGGGGIVHFGGGITETVSKQGNLIYYEVCPDYGFKASEILINGVNQTIFKNGEACVYSFIMPSENVTVSVKFKEKLFYISANVTGEGSVKFGSGGTSSATVRQGVDVNFTVTPFDGYKVTEILADKTPLKILNDGLSATYAYNMPENSVTLSVKFALITPVYTLTAENSGGGNIDFDTLNKPRGETVSVRVAPNDGFKVASVKINGVSLTVLNDGFAATYSFSMPDENAKFSVEFEKINAGGDKGEDSGSIDDKNTPADLSGDDSALSDNNFEAKQKSRIIRRIIIFTSATLAFCGIILAVVFIRRKKRSAKQ